MVTIGVFTTTRAEFGIFIPLLECIMDSNDFDYKLFVGGTHLKKEYGFTIDEIYKKGLKIHAKFDYLVEGNTMHIAAKSAAIATDKLSYIFENFDFDFTCILGDRYELLSIVQNSIIFNRPIIHIHGGEESQGAIDEQIRHMITKAAHIHFVACSKYASNVKNMGEESWRVFNTGALAVENMAKISNFELTSLNDFVEIENNESYALMSFHAETNNNKIKPSRQIEIILEALAVFEGKVLITGSNADFGSKDIEEVLKSVISSEKYHFCQSFGMIRYLTLMKFADFIIGNSSSGIIEAPYFKTPTVNIGNRQKGRYRHPSIIDCKCNLKEIEEAITLSLNKEFILNIQNMKYEFGDTNVSNKMLDALRKLLPMKEKLLNKKLEFPCK